MNAKKKIIVSVTNDLSTDQRVRRICDFLHANDYEITLVGRLRKNSLPINDRPYRCRRFRLWFNKGPLFYANYNLRLFFFLLVTKADVLLANDLDTLLANHWARKLKPSRRLVYDSHEYYCGTPELVSRPKVQNIWRKIERKTLPGVDAMYTVNHSIADLYKEEYGLDIKVVRNISDPRKIELNTTKEQLGLPTDKKIVIMQGAGINIDRGAEEAIEAIQLVENAILIFVGDGDVIPILKEEVAKKGWEEKVKFFGKRPYEELMNFTMHADLGLSLDKNSNINYRFSLPNKIFDFIHAGTPIMVSNLPEVRKVVEGYEVGYISASHDIEVLAKEIGDLLNNSSRLEQYKQNMKKAAKELNWQNECKVLEGIYGRG